VRAESKPIEVITSGDISATSSLNPPANLANLKSMRLIIYLKKINNCINAVYLTEKEITASIAVEFHVPFIKWNQLIKLSAIVAFIKETLKTQSQYNYFNNLSNALHSVKKEEMDGAIKRCYGNLTLPTSPASNKPPTFD
jgi:hypothetical protein